MDLFDALKRKKSGKHLSRAERESCQRVQNVLSDLTASPQVQGLALNEEIGGGSDNLLVSREWKKELSVKFESIFHENNLDALELLCAERYGL